MTGDCNKQMNYPSLRIYHHAFTVTKCLSPEKTQPNEIKLLRFHA